jgi:hypothetical protein
VIRSNKKFALYLIEQWASELFFVVIGMVGMNQQAKPYTGFAHNTLLRTCCQIVEIKKLFGGLRKHVGKIVNGNS